MGLVMGYLCDLSYLREQRVSVPSDFRADRPDHLSQVELYFPLGLGRRAVPGLASPRGDRRETTVE